MNAPAHKPRLGGSRLHPGSPDAKEMFQQIKRGADKFRNAMDIEGMPPAMGAWAQSQIVVILNNYRRYLDPGAKETT